MIDTHILWQSNYWIKLKILKKNELKIRFLLIVFDLIWSARWNFTIWLSHFMAKTQMKGNNRAEFQATDWTCRSSI